MAESDTGSDTVLRYDTMIKHLIGVAVSTTGDPHRMGFLETTVARWRAVLPLGSDLVVTVDGSEEDAQRARLACGPTKFGTVYRVGQKTSDVGADRLGVAANKNTGLELLMGQGCQQIFLCDDDTGPLSMEALSQHIHLSEFIPHSMVGWGKHRHPSVMMADWGMYSTWSWPRGVLLHTTAQVIGTVGGMVEAFGAGGHEHVEWSRRIHQAGFTPELFCSPAAYAHDGPWSTKIDPMAAERYWACEDMPKAGEPLGDLRQRRKKITSVRRPEGHWASTDAIMVAQDGNTAFVPYTASENGRASATLCHDVSTNLTGRGAGEVGEA